MTPEQVNIHRNEWLSVKNKIPYVSNKVDLLVLLRKERPLMERYYHSAMLLIVAKNNELARQLSRHDGKVSTC